MADINSLRGTPHDYEEKYNKAIKAAQDAAVIAATAASVLTTNPAVAQENIQRDPIDDGHKIEMVDQQKTNEVKQDENALNFADEAKKVEKAENTNSETELISELEKISFYTDKDGTYVSLNGGKNVEDIDKIQTTRQAKKDYNKQQKEDFEKAPADTTVVRSLEEFSNDQHLGKFSPTDKNIIITKIDETENVEAFVDNLPPKEGISKEQRVQDAEDVVKRVNSSESQESTNTHESQHRINDKDGLYAPGLNPEQVGKLVCWDEVSANVAQLALANHQYQEKIKAGISKEEAMKVFSATDDRFAFYTDALKNGMDPSSEQAKELMVQGTTKMWRDTFFNMYDSEIKDIMVGYDNTKAGTVIGDGAEYQKRMKEMFDSIDENPILKEQGVKIGNLSKYLPKEDFELTIDQKEIANDITKKKTGLSAESGRVLRETLPGNDKQDQKVVTKMYKSQKEMGRHITKLRGISKPKNNKTSQEQGQVKTQTQTNVNVAQLATQQSQGR